MEIITREEAKARGLKFYLAGKPCRRGHESERYTSTGACVECAKLMNSVLYTENRDEILMRGKAYRDKNADEIRRRDAIRRDRDREKRRLKDAAYRAKNKEKISKWHVEHRKRLRKTNPVYALKHGIRALFASAFKRNGCGKNTKTSDILGCSWDEFVVHIERQFLPGMTWGNRHLWHIDHIIPVSTAKTEADVIALNHVSNLRPMWGKENIEKGDKILFLI